MFFENYFDKNQFFQYILSFLTVSVSAVNVCTIQRNNMNQSYTKWISTCEQIVAFYQILYLSLFAIFFRRSKLNILSPLSYSVLQIDTNCRLRCKIQWYISWLLALLYHYIYVRTKKAMKSQKHEQVSQYRCASKLIKKKPN